MLDENSTLEEIDAEIEKLYELRDKVEEKYTVTGWNAYVFGDKVEFRSMQVDEGQFVSNYWSRTKEEALEKLINNVAQGERSFASQKEIAVKYKEQNFNK